MSEPRRLPLIERAFELAKLGKATTVAKIEDALSREGCFPSTLEDPTLRRQLKALIADAKVGRLPSKN